MTFKTRSGETFDLRPAFLRPMQRTAMLALVEQARRQRGRGLIGVAFIAAAFWVGVCTAFVLVGLRP